MCGEQVSCPCINYGATVWPYIAALPAQTGHAGQRALALGLLGCVSYSAPFQYQVSISIFSIFKSRPLTLQMRKPKPRVSAFSRPHSLEVTGMLGWVS
jgi:hypothetical protein